MAITGNLRTMQLSELLQWLSMGQKTGTLVVRGQPGEKRVFFENGRIISSSSTIEREYLGHFLVAYGYITEEELTRAMEVQHQSKILLGKILVMIGAIREEDLTELLKLKAQETIYDIFLWTEGAFEFIDKEIPQWPMVPISIDVTGIVMEGLRRYDEWERIKTRIKSLREIPALTKPVNPQDLPDRERIMLQGIDGAQSIDQIAIATHNPEFHVAKFVFELLEAGQAEIVGERWEHPPIPSDLTLEDPAAMVFEEATEPVFEGGPDDPFAMPSQPVPDAAGDDLFSATFPVAPQAGPSFSSMPFPAQSAPAGYASVPIPVITARESPFAPVPQPSPFAPVPPSAPAAFSPSAAFPPSAPFPGMAPAPQAQNPPSPFPPPPNPVPTVVGPFGTSPGGPQAFITAGPWDPTRPTARAVVPLPQPPEFSAFLGRRPDSSAYDRTQGPVTPPPERAAVFRPEQIQTSPSQGRPPERAPLPPVAPVPLSVPAPAPPASPSPAPAPAAAPPAPAPPARPSIPANAKPILNRKMEDLMSYSFTPNEAFILTRINGQYDVKSIVKISPFPEIEVLRVLEKLQAGGVISLR
ncbi:MAG: DUF4388 domain-containing protein [Thermoanaerobaculia bacterium]|nr:DUF4388 domain-containing protein [Thermoanaerobaculia bacterium]